jgi:hypothetical protein
MEAKTCRQSKPVARYMIVSHLTLQVSQLWTTGNLRKDATVFTVQHSLHAAAILSNLIRYEVIFITNTRRDTEWIGTT